jgi:anthraniloyl-CoA monooxygenase
MRVVCVGGGPAGLYFAISMKRRDPAHEVVVIERNRPGDAFGWGVVFSDVTLESLWRNDRESAQAISDSFARWDDIDVHFKGRVVRSGGHGFTGIARKRLLNILQTRARELGVALRFETEVESLEPYRDADLIVAADGVNSRTRSRFASALEPSVEVRRNKYIWLGTRKAFEAFTFIFEQTEHGWIWAHAYRFDETTSTFIVECGEATWRALGFDQMSAKDGVAACEMLFARYLDGQALMSNAAHLRGSAWLNFSRVACERWYHGKVVLIGDAAHSAHFSVGSGTKLALEDAIGLAEALDSHDDLPSALEDYQETRRVEVLKLQSAARNSTEWFEAVPRYVHRLPIGSATRPASRPWRSATSTSRTM